MNHPLNGFLIAAAAVLYGLNNELIGPAVLYMENLTSGDCRGNLYTHTPFQQ